MFEDMTYTRLLTRQLARVQNDVDKREGAIVCDAMAPSAAELAILYSTLSGEMNRAFPDTAEDVDLTNKAKERGVIRLPATAAVRTGTFTGPAGNMDIPIGSRFSGGSVNYIATKKISLGVFQMTCEEAGAAGNDFFGSLIPIDYIPNLTTATLGEILIPGEDEESDDDLRARYMESLESTAFGGNVAQYKEQVKKIAGVGLVKIFPAFAGGYKPSDLNLPDDLQDFIDSTDMSESVDTWIRTVSAAIQAGAVTVGGGTVRVVIVDSEGGVPSSTLVQTVQTTIDPEENHGEGLGLVPIGHRAQVAAATGTTVNVAFSLTFDSASDWSLVSESVTDAITAYFAELITGWEDASYLVVRISQLESRILDVAGVVDITGTTLNGIAANLILSKDAIPVIGTVTNT